MKPLRFRKLPGIVASVTHCFGRPCVEGRRVPVTAIVSRFRAGESVAALATDYRLTVGEVENAIRFALSPHRARFERAADARFRAYAKSKRAWWKNIRKGGPT